MLILILIQSIFGQDCRDGWHYYRENCYLVTDYLVTFDQFNIAESACQQLSGHLLSLLDRSEMNFVYQLNELTSVEGSNKGYNIVILMWLIFKDSARSLSHFLSRVSTNQRQLDPISLIKPRQTYT